MSLSLIPLKKALAPYAVAPFLGVGGTAPYTYSVVAGGVGGFIDPLTGVYTAPGVTGFETVKVTDSLLATATVKFSVLTPLQLVCDIIESEMGLANDQVYLWNQKVDIPNDSRMYVAIGVLSVKPFGNQNTLDSSGKSVQTINTMSTLSIDILSRGPDARDRKEEVLLALASNYSQSQQELNSFHIGKISTAFVNVSDEQGAALLYRFNISVNIQSMLIKKTPVEYYDDFSGIGPQINTDT